MEELGIPASLENSKTVGVSQLGSLLITPLFTQKNTILDPRADLIITFLKYKPLIRLVRFFLFLVALNKRLSKNGHSNRKSTELTVLIQKIIKSKPLKST